MDSDRRIQEIIDQARFQEQERAASIVNAQFNESAVRNAEIQRKIENKEQNLELCHKFIGWATLHRIPYDSPSRFAPGWLLGSRITATRSYSPKTVTGKFHDFAKILATRDGTLMELDISKAFGPLGKRRSGRLARNNV